MPEPTPPMPTPPPPVPPAVPRPPSPTAIPPIASVPGSRKKLRLPKFIFALFGLILILGVGIFTGQVSRFVPGLGSVTLTYWGLWEPNEVIRPVLDEFEKTHPGVKVEYKFQSHIEYSERLKAALSQGRGPDIFRIHNTWTPVFSQYLSSVPASVYSVSDYNKIFYPVAASDFGIGNTYYAVPLEIDGISMFINDDLLSKAKLARPETWSDLRNAAIAMSVCASPDSTCRSGGKVIVSGAAMGNTQNVDHWQDIIAVLMFQNNVGLNNPSQLNTFPAEDVINYFTSFSSEYHLWDPNLPSSTNSFAAGKVGIYFGPSWRVFDIQNLNPNLKFSVHPIPQLPIDPNKGEKPMTYASYWAEAVNNKSSHQAQAWELIKYLSSPEVMRKIYQQASTPLRSFGEPYSRQDMASELSSSKLIAPFVSQAPIAKSWYLASYTHDGPNGLNSRLSAVFADVISGAKRVSTLGTEINTVLSAYGLGQAPSP